jgi:hypothetical protein
VVIRVHPQSSPKKIKNPRTGLDISSTFLKKIDEINYSLPTKPPVL